MVDLSDPEKLFKEISKEEIKIKNICPVIGMISSWKSSILNVLFNTDILEVTPQITTKIVTIIRYNENVKDKPIFYKLSLEKNENNDYKFYKEKISKITGKDKIKKKIKELNEELNQKQPEYEDIFYMLEIGQSYLEEDFLKNYDLADIPGVSEHIKQNITNISENAEENNIKDSNNFFQNTEEELNNYKIEQEIDYLTKIFKILKYKIKTGIFIFSVDKFQLSDNYQIVGKIGLILDKPMENFLILLNKMDISENIENDIELLKGNFTQEFPNGLLNITRNTIVPCCSFQLENELNMDKDYCNLLYCHYINYMMNSKHDIDFVETLKNFVETFEEKEVESIDKKTFEKNIKSIEKDINLDKIKDLIKKINYKHDVENNPLSLSEDDFDENSIKNCLNYLEEDDEDNKGKINLSKQTNNTIKILYYYYLFKNNKLKLSKSNHTNQILNYFTIKNMKVDFAYKEAKQKLKELETMESYNKKVEKIIKFLTDLYDVYEKEGIYPNLRENFKKSMKPIINTFITSKMFFIPLLGTVNSGKSTILNGLIGYNLLPTKKGECSKRGILVNYWDYDIPILRKAKLIVENTGDFNDICYFKISDDIITQGYENIKQYLQSLNCNFTEEEENFFYIINIKIQFLDNFTKNEERKENFVL